MKTVSQLTETYKLYILYDLEAVKSAYENLELAQASVNLFGQYDWYQNFVTYVVGLEREQAVFLVLETAPNNVVAILPLKESKSRRTLSSLTNYYSALYDVVYNVKLHSRKEVLSTILILGEEYFKHFSYIQLELLEPEVAKDFSSAFLTSWLKGIKYVKTQNWFSLFNTKEDFSLSCSKKLRNTLRRKSTKLEREKEYSFEIVKNGTSVQKLLSEYQEIYLKSWKKLEPYPGFIPGLVNYGVPKDMIRLGVLYVEGKAVASQIWLVDNEHAFIYKLAYDSEYAKYSPGTLLTNEIANYVIEYDGVSKIDFLTGNDAYKQDWMNNQQPLYNLCYFNLRTWFGLCMFLREKGSQLKQFVST
ncbi:GNAT family N-acetyltransferase [Flocculibacter collagenilyticus]|uniref:GNAT family N-acetyltransferase n=1 Tax=Flocculibacter collagenilyticus TaxID=2744479 RepID=UPI0018F305CA|nr:GNAT family N-acetyltransferase [Flocculibacter collagenilyticus]